MNRIVKLQSSIFVRLVVTTGMIALGSLGQSSLAHFPDTANHPVHVRPSFRSPGYYISGYRERYNRPTYIGGKIAYLIAPTSQEAISWHRSVHRGYYANHAPRMEDRYFSPKPWEALTVGARKPVGGMPEGEDSSDEKAKPGSKASPEVDSKDDDGTVKSAPTIELVPTPDP